MALIGLLLALPALGASMELEPSAGTGTVLLSHPTNHEDVMRHLRLERDKSAYLRTEYNVKRVSVGNPAVLDVVVLSPRELHLVPKAIGSTNVVLWDPSGVPKAAIDVNVGTTHSHLESELRRVLENENVEVDSAGSSIVLKGSVPSELALEQALTVASAFFPREGKKGGAEIINLMEVGGHQQVMIEVTIAEMNRLLRRNLQSNWIAIRDNGNIQLFSLLQSLTSVNGDIVNLTDSVNLIGRFFDSSGDSFQFFFDLLDEKGMAKILAEPTLVARSGESANFLVGGEIPIPVAQGGAFGSITIEFKEFGVGLSFIPTVLSEERIHMQLTTEVSEPDFSLGTALGGVTIPAFNTRRASSGFELGDGQSFAIAGLLRDDVSELMSRYPLLGDIPILGTLFRSSQFERQETELVVIVTPRLVKPLGPGPHPLPTDHYVAPNAWEFFLLGTLEHQFGSDSDATDVAEASAPATEPGVAPATKTGGLIGDAGHRVAISPLEEE